MALVGAGLAVWTIVNAFSDDPTPAGWASTMVAILVIGGIILLSLGIVAEYIGVVVNQVMGKPPYLIVSDPADGPLGSVADSRDT
jgi:undecaprenyl-phosphate 4-deoxy-4-formamido-L-arabinose transferase